MAIRCIAEAHGENWSMYNGDCVSVMQQMPDSAIDYSIYSPPFGALFVYSESAADMGNSTDEQFAEHYGYMVREKFRLTKPGRLTSVHCSDLPMTKWKDGEVGIKDFSGDIIRAHEAAGWVLHCKTTIWKDPVVEMTRTKALGLLYKQLIKDSSRSRTGMPDYLLTFRKPGENAEPITHEKDDLPVELWQKIASPVWYVNQTRVLNVKAAKENGDEKHLCPLQLDVIEWATLLWSNRGNIVLSPCGGIGSEGVGSLKFGRKYLGIELKPNYFKQACGNLTAMEAQRGIFETAA